MPKPSRRRLEPSPLPPNPAFWAALNREYSAAEAQRVQPGPHDHYRQPMRWLRQNCDECHRKKLDWMLAQPRGSHYRRHGERIQQIIERRDANAE